MDIAQHSYPAWRHKADYAIGIKVMDSVWSKRYKSEQLAARKISDTEFEICCIPFLVYDLCLGDIVSVDEELDVNKVTEQQGHYGFRVITKSSQDQEKIANLMRSNGHMTETFGSICAIDAVDKQTAKEISAILMKAKKSKEIAEYETIRMSNID